MQKKNRAKKNAKPNPFRKQNLQGIQGFIFLNTEQNRVGILGFFRGDFMFFVTPCFEGEMDPKTRPDDGETIRKIKIPPCNNATISYILTRILFSASVRKKH